MIFNRIVVWIAESALHSLVSGSIVIVKYRGKRSGTTYSLPVNYVIVEQSGGNRRLWITSKKERVWWRNFIGGHDATLVLRGERIATELVALDAQEQVANGLKSYLSRSPGAARYFDVRIDENGQFDEADLGRAADQRVILFADL